jgi:hypothetical protein
LQQVGPASGFVFRVERARGPQWYGKWREPGGRQVKRRIGPAWTSRGRPAPGFFTRRTAEDWLRATLLELDDAATRGADLSVTFAEAAHEWLRYVEEDRAVKPTTLRNYRSSVEGKLIPAFGERRLRDITPADIDSDGATRSALRPTSNASDRRCSSGEAKGGASSSGWSVGRAAAPSATRRVFSRDRSDLHYSQRTAVFSVRPRKSTCAGPAASREAFRMRPLGTVTATPEQLTVIEDGSPGFWLIRGSAGSGKTTTALLRLKFLVRLWRERAQDLGLGAVRVLVLTFNRTLRGYIESLAEQQVALGADVALEVDTFSHWAINLVGQPVVDGGLREEKLLELARGTRGLRRWPSRFLVGEVDYLLGRLLPEDLDRYLVLERTGRGRAPRVDRSTRDRLLDGVIRPYRDWKEGEHLYDWNDLAVALATEQLGPSYNVVVVDESQDFSANQVRAIVNHLADDHVTTFIRDSAQRIFPHSFTWSDVGIAIPPPQNKKLEINYRNTKQIAAFAKPLLEGVEATEDSTLPNFEGCVRDGARPVVLRGLYSEQLNWAIDYLRSGKIGPDETVAFLHPLGWFNALRPRLRQERLDWAEITASRDWPDGPEQIALSTMASGKGLEFDHVIIIGYNGEVVPHGEEPDHALLDEQRRLLAMAIGRARRSVVLGYKPEDEPAPLGFLDPNTYQRVDL